MYFLVLQIASTHLFLCVEVLPIRARLQKTLALSTRRESAMEEITGAKTLKLNEGRLMRMDLGSSKALWFAGQ